MADRSELTSGEPVVRGKVTEGLTPGANELIADGDEETPPVDGIAAALLMLDSRELRIDANELISDGSAEDPGPKEMAADGDEEIPPDGTAAALSLLLD